MKKHRALAFTLSGAIALSCLLAGCDTVQSQHPSDPVTASDIISLPPDDTSSPAISSGSPFIVKDVNGGDYDLASTPWGIKYPFMVEYFRALLEEIRANGGDETMENDLCSNWTKTLLPESCITAFGTPAISLLGFDKEGNFDPNGPQLTTTIRSAVLDETTTLAPELLKAAYQERAETQGYLTVELTVENTGSEEVNFTLNSIRPYVFVNGELAHDNTVTEMMSASNTEGSISDSSFFHCTLAPGQSQDYTAVFYADCRIELEDIFLELNYTGLNVAPIPTEDPIIDAVTGIFCALK